MTNDTVKASKILFDLVQTLEPRLAPLKGWFFGTLLPTVDKWQRSEGDQGVKRAKDILGRGWLEILGENPGEPAPFVKTTKGTPNLVLPLVTRVKSQVIDPRLLSATLTLIRVTDLFMARGDQAQVLKQIRVINDSRLPSKAKGIISEFQTFVHDFLANCPDKAFKQAFAQSLKIRSNRISGEKVPVGDFYSEKSGPNGRLTEMAAVDYVTNRNYTFPGSQSTFVEGIKRLEHAVCENVDAQSLTASDGWSEVPDDVLTRGRAYSPVPGKISQITEKSGKTRLVASPDYFSQRAMKPIHDWLMGLLRSIPMDCTFDQRSAIPKIVSWHERESTIYSFDQSSCTDLFPVVCQLNVLRERFGEPLTEAARTVMCDRQWSVKLPSGQTKLVHWGVGQPMGLYGSWPLMAVTHHLLVQFAAWRSSGRKSWKPYRDYVICGDDIVIASKSVASSYLKVVRMLGMKINMTKSHVTGGKTGIPPVSEFAKITIWKGKPLFPVRPNMVLAAVKDWRMVVPLFCDLTNVEGFSARRRFLERRIIRWFPSKKKYLLPLLDIPKSFGGVGLRGSQPFKSQFSDLKVGQIHPWLYYLGCQIRSHIKLEMEEFSTSLESLPDQAFEEHPLWVILQEAKSEGKLDKFNINYWSLDQLPSVEQICEDLMFDGLGQYKPFLPEINGYSTDAPPPHWEEENSRELRHKRSIWEKCLRRRHAWSQDVVSRQGRLFLTVANLAPQSQLNVVTRILTVQQKDDGKFHLS